MNLPSFVFINLLLSSAQCFLIKYADPIPFDLAILYISVLSIGTLILIANDSKLIFLAADFFLIKVNSSFVLFFLGFFLTTNFLLT